MVKDNDDLKLLQSICALIIQLVFLTSPLLSLDTGSFQKYKDTQAVTKLSVQAPSKSKYCLSSKYCKIEEIAQSLKNKYERQKSPVTLSDQALIKLYKETPEFFGVGPNRYHKDAVNLYDYNISIWSPLTFWENNNSWGIQLLRSSYNLYNPDKADQVRQHLSSNDGPAVLGKLDHCLSKDPMILYPTLVQLTPIEMICMKYSHLFPNLIFEEVVKRDDTKKLKTIYETNNKRLVNIKENVILLATFYLCISHKYNDNFPSEISSIILNFILSKQFEISLMY